MRRLATALTMLTIPFAAHVAEAKGPVAEGATTTVSIKMSVKEKTKSDWRSSAIDRVLNAQCVMVAGPVTQVARDGLTAEQQAATAQAQSNAQTFEQNYAPSQNMQSQMQAMMEKCGEDEACMMAEAQKLAQTPEMQAMAKKKDQAIADMAGLNPDLGPARYQMWMPQSCTGTITANDTYVVSDAGGEGGYGAYTDTTTVKGTAPIDAAWKGLAFETDTVGNTTTYQMVAPPEVVLASVSSRTGNRQVKIPLLASTALPRTIGPLKGVLGKQSTQIPGQDGGVSVVFQGK